MLPTRMRAVEYHAPNDIRLIDVPVPTIGPGELLVQVAACGVCGSDTLDWYLQPRAPLFLGHEPTGTVVAVGEGAQGFAAGDRVFVHHRVPCGICDLCRRGHETLCPSHRTGHIEPGGLAEYVRVPATHVARDVLHLPADMSWEQATLIEPASTCVRAIGRLAVADDSVVAIIGGGFAGLTLAALARHAGARSVVVIEPVAFRRQRALELGATLALDPDHEHLRAQLVDHAGTLATIAIVAASNLSAVYGAFELLDKGGTLLIFAPPPRGRAAHFDLAQLFFGEITLTASYGSGPQDTRRALDLIRSGVIDASRLITHRFPFEQAVLALAQTATPGPSLKSIVTIAAPDEGA
jgi:L-iditol 2-dehydrogenase